MSDKARNWSKSKVNIEQVKQNTQNAQQYVDLTEKYKTLGSQIENKIDSLFNFLGTHFTSFDPNLSFQQELDKSGQKERIIKLLHKAVIPAPFDARIMDSKNHREYARTFPENDLKYSMAIATEDFSYPSRKEHSEALTELQALHVSLASLQPKEKINKVLSWILPKDKTVGTILKTQIQFKEAIKDYFDTHYTTINNKVADFMEIVRKEFEPDFRKIDPYNVTQLNAAVIKLQSPEDKKVLEEWAKKAEAKEFFFNITEGLHDDYSAFLELDKRTGEKTKGGITEKITDILGGVKAFFTGGKTENAPVKGEAKTETPSLFQKFFSIFDTSKATKQDDVADTKTDDDEVTEEVIDLSDCQEVSSPSQSQLLSSLVVKTVAVEAYESIEQVHKEYQTLLAALIDAKKVTCFSNVMQITKVASSCLIRKPFEQATSENKFDCASLDTKAKMAMAECDYIFPFATDSDDIISEFLNKSSKVEVNIYEDGKTGLRSHVDEVVADLTIALGQAVVNNYKALPSGATQKAMEAVYQAPLDKEQADKGTLQIEGHDQAFPHDNANALVLPTALPAPAQDVL